MEKRSLSSVLTDAAVSCSHFQYIGSAHYVNQKFADFGLGLIISTQRITPGIDPNFYFSRHPAVKNYGENVTLILQMHKAERRHRNNK